MVDKEIIQIKTREVYHLLLVKDVDVLMAHRLLRQIYNVVWYRHLVQTAKTPEAESLARWSVDNAREELDATLHSMQLCTLDRALVRYVANNYEFDDK